jgi:alkanesulfonate monooxygenase SsuD/methylene tetrahydromethanopterin reductase-like flavin-dependent oxidoreductase (luciferase family)
MGDGWMGSALVGEADIVASVQTIRAEAEAVGRDPDSIGMQMMLQPPPSRPEDKDYYADHDQVVRRVVRLQELGFEWVSLNATAIFQAGARSVDAMIDQLGQLHNRITAEV